MPDQLDKASARAAPSCPGPLVWFDVNPCPDRCEHLAAVLECGTCGYVVTSGNFMDGRHAHTPIMRSSA